MKYLQKSRLIKDEMESIADSIDIKIIPEDKLISRTIEAKQNWYRQCEYTDTQIAELTKKENIDSATMARWVVNYIRHNLTKYDSNVEDLQGKPGKNVAYNAYKNAVLSRIALAYPQYASECKRQIRAW